METNSFINVKPTMTIGTLAKIPNKRLPKKVAKNGLHWNQRPLEALVISKTGASTLSPSMPRELIVTYLQLEARCPIAL